MNADAENPGQSVQSSDKKANARVVEPHPARIFQGLDWLSFGITTGLSLGVYLWTLAPSVTLEESGIFCTGAMHASATEPPGYPLWSIYAWLFIKLLPFSNIAWRASVSSAVAGALTCGIIALITSRGAGLVVEGFLPPFEPKHLAVFRLVGGYLAGMAFGFEGGFWRTAVVVSSWPFGLLLFSLSLCFLTKWFFFPEMKRWLYFGCLLYGLAVSNNQSLFAAGLGLQILITLAKPALGRDMFFADCLVAFASFVTNGVGSLFPIWSGDSSWLTRIHLLLLSPSHRIALVVATLSLALCIGATVKTRKILTEWKVTLVSGVMFLIGFLPYLYLPLASMTNPPVNWGYPRTVVGFFHVLTRGQFERISPAPNLERFLKATFVYLDVSVTEFGWPYLLLASAPFLFLFRMQPSVKRWVSGIAAVFLSLTVTLIAGSNPSSDRGSVELVEVIFSASHFLIAILAGLGAVLLGWRINRKLAVPAFAHNS